MNEYTAKVLPATEEYVDMVQLEEGMVLTIAGGQYHIRAKKQKGRRFELSFQGRVCKADLEARSLEDDVVESLRGMQWHEFTGNEKFAPGTHVLTATPLKSKAIGDRVIWDVSHLVARENGTLGFGKTVPSIYMVIILPGVAEARKGKKNG